MTDVTTYKNLGESVVLQVGQRYQVGDSGVFYLLLKGALTLFITDRGDEEARPRYFSSYRAPALIPVPGKDESSVLQLHANDDCEMVKLTVGDIERSDKELQNSLVTILTATFRDYPGNFVLGKPELQFSKYACGKTVKATFATDIYAAKPEECAWLITVNGEITLGAETAIPSGRVFPLTHAIWYRVAAQGVYEVVRPENVLEKVDGFFGEVIGFSKAMFVIDRQLQKARQMEAVKQVYAGQGSDQGHRDFSYRKLMELVKPVDYQPKEQGAQSPLMTCLNAIGRYEQIVFKSPSGGRADLSELENVLLISKVRSMEVKLPENWYKSNNGALLGYHKDTGDPVAFIPAGDSSYRVLDPVTGAYSSVDALEAQNYQTKAHVFFTSFDEKSLSGKGILLFALRFVKKELISAVLIGSVSALIALFIPFITGYIFDMVIPNSNLSELGQIVFLLLTVAITMGILNYAQSITVLRLEGKASYRLQAAVWDRLLSLKVRFFHTFSSGDMTERSMGIEKLRQVLSGSVLSAVVAFVFSFFYLALLFYYSVKLALVALALGMIIVIFTITASYYGFKHVMVIRYLDTVLTGFLFQVVSGINKIRTTNSEERVFSQWIGRFAFQKNHYAAKRRVNTAGEVFGSMFPLFSAVVILVTTHQIFMSSEDFTVGDFIAFNNAFLSFQGALLQMSMVTVPVLTVKPIFNMFKPILEAESEHSREREPLGEIRGEINVKNLKFRYEENLKPVIDGLSLKIHQGEYIALVGGSGSGKSTLVRLLIGFEDPQEGQVLIDGKDLSKIDLQDYRSKVGIVLQNEKLMTGTIRYNILGNTTLTDKDAWEAARKAGCAHEIERLPDKMDTFVKSDTETLSGGQIQRIVIARALARNPRILFFDEATSALDNITQRIITETLAAMNITRIVIAHRLSTIKNANRILVVDGGKIVEQGSYEKLLEKNGVFAKLVRKQFSDET